MVGCTATETSVRFDDVLRRIYASRDF